MSTKEKIYNIVICLLAIVSIIFAVKDLLSGLTTAEYIFDNVIYGIFIIDYIVRIIVTKDKKKFVKSNIFDLIAILPFNSAFRAFRLFKAFRFLKFTKFIRILSVSVRAGSKAKRFLNTNGLKYVILITSIAILVSSVCMSYFEKMSFSDALWWSFVTTTTVGYGDLSPATTVGRIIAVLLMLIGIGMLGSLTSSITSFFLHEEKAPSCNSEKIDMVKTLYDKLSDDEKKQFEALIRK